MSQAQAGLFIEGIGVIRCLAAVSGSACSSKGATVRAGLTQRFPEIEAYFVPNSALRRILSSDSSLTWPPPS